MPIQCVVKLKSHVGSRRGATLARRPELPHMSQFAVIQLLDKSMLSRGLPGETQRR